MANYHTFKLGALACAILCLTACGSGGGEQSPTPTPGRSSTALSSSGVVSSEVSSNEVSSNAVSSSAVSSSAVSLNASSVMMPQSSSSVINSSSSQTTVTVPVVQFVYPTQQAHLGGRVDTPLKLKMLKSAVLNSSVSQIFVGTVQLVLTGDDWVSQTSLVLDSTDDQVFEVRLILDDGSEIQGQNLVLNNKGGSTVTKAGTQRVNFARGLALDIEDQKIYVSDPLDAKIYSLNLKTGESDQLFQLPPSEDIVADLSWPLGVDSEKDELYLLQDTYGYNESLGSQGYQIKLHRINASTGESNEYEDSNIDRPNFRINSVRNIFVDTDKNFLPTTISTGSFSAIFSIDNRNSNRLIRWFTEGAVEGKTSSLSISGNQLKTDYNLSSFAFNPADKKLYVARTYSDIGKRGSVGIVAVEAENDPFDGLSLNANLWVNLPDFKVPSAMLFSPDGTVLYIADSARIWALNTETKAVTLLSSSNIIPNKKGEGVSLNSNITAMALDQSAGILYVAANTDGVIAIDIESGNRIAILK